MKTHRELKSRLIKALLLCSVALSSTQTMAKNNCSTPALNPAKGVFGYKFAANEHKTVTVKGATDIAYGANGKFKYLYKKRQNFICNSSAFGGDPISGVAKKCYTRASDTGDAPLGFTFAAKAKTKFNIEGTVNLAYGSKGKFKYIYNVYNAKSCGQKTISCDASTFRGDPNVGVKKQCYYQVVSGSKGPSGFNYASEERAKIDVNTKAKLAFGANGKFKYLTNKKSDTTCSSSAFGGDPISGVKKSCYSQNNKFEPYVDAVSVKNGIRHPGQMSTIGQLKRLKLRYAAKDATTVALVKDLLNKINRSGIRIRNPGKENPATGGRALIFCGSYNKGKDGVTKVQACDWPAQDGVDAYTYALLGYITGQSKYTDLAINYIKSWSNVKNFAGFDTKGSNAPLQHGWVLPWFTNTAEILRYTSSSWTTALTKSMNDFVNRLLPLVTKNSQGYPNNWIHARIEGHIASAIWLNDKTMLNTALTRWKQATRTYFYIDSDKGVPLAPLKKISRSIPDYWDSKVFVPGLAMETCRDLNHQNLGVLSIFNSMMMAHSQGADLLTGNDNRERLLTYMEVSPRWTQSLSAHPDGVCKKEVVIKGNDATGLKLAKNTVRYPLPLGYYLLKTSSRPLGLAKQDITKSDSVIADRWVTKWESLLMSSLK